MEIERLGGTADRLYQLVARLVMNPDVLRENNNYPFKTSEHYIWFVALEEEVVVGFMPVEMKRNCAIINNYYVEEESEEVLDALLGAVTSYIEPDCKLQAVALSRDMDVFQKNHFEIVRTWKLYVKMEQQLPQQ